MSVMPIPRSIRESLGYALIRNAQTIALIVENGILICGPLVFEMMEIGRTASLGGLSSVALNPLDDLSRILMYPMTTMTKITMFPVKCLLGLPSEALYPLGGLAIVALYRMNFFQDLNHGVQGIINDLGVRLKDLNPGVQSIINDLGVRLIREEGLRIRDEDLRELRALLGAAHFEIVEEIEENL